jgi:hypothetical protein
VHAPTPSGVLQIGLTFVSTFVSALSRAKMLTGTSFMEFADSIAAGAVRNFLNSRPTEQHYPSGRRCGLSIPNFLVESPRELGPEPGLQPQPPQNESFSSIRGRLSALRHCPNLEPGDRTLVRKSPPLAVSASIKHRFVGGETTWLGWEGSSLEMVKSEKNEQALARLRFWPDQQASGDRDSAFAVPAVTNLEIGGCRISEGNGRTIFRRSL